MNHFYINKQLNRPPAPASPFPRCVWHLKPLFFLLLLPPLFPQQNLQSFFKMCPSGSSLGAAKGSNLRTAFDLIDADRDGKISRDDLRMFYSGFSTAGGGVVAADEDDDIIGSMISAADFNKDGFVEYDEFERVCVGGGGKRKRSLNGGIMEDVFRVMDKDGDGKLTHSDLKSYMQWAGFDAGDDDIKAMIGLGGCGDGDKDGLSFDDLLKILAVDFVG